MIGVKNNGLELDSIAAITCNYEYTKTPSMSLPYTLRQLVYYYGENAF